jgi:hypothetical protein
MIYHSESLSGRGRSEQRPYRAPTRSRADPDRVERTAIRREAPTRRSQYGQLSMRPPAQHLADPLKDSAIGAS